ncbi:MAG: hypothetical protein HY899_08715 [Deltaproteobacteria bacterium]|nr:hypothetical protein [Deltaproteobacteria bacterium]
MPTARLGCTLPTVVIDRRLQFIVGKGGVGKSTLTAALALSSAAKGRRTLAIELAAPGGVARLFGVAAAAGNQAVAVRPGLSLMWIEGESALTEYLSLVVPIKRLLKTVFSSRLYRVFVAAAPGLKELMAIGKIWYEAQKTCADGSPLWERIFIDAGASGHSLQYLQMPSAAAATFQSGLVHRESMRVEALLKDAETTCVHVVATPEEMPLGEAAAIVARLRDPLALPLGDLIVNRCRPAPPAGVAAAVEALAEIRIESGDEPVRGALLGAVRTALGWQLIQEQGLAHITAETGIEPLRLPLLVREEFGLAEVEEVARSLDGRAVAKDGS